LVILHCYGDTAKMFEKYAGGAEVETRGAFSLILTFSRWEKEQPLDRCLKFVPGWS